MPKNLPPRPKIFRFDPKIFSPKPKNFRSRPKKSTAIGGMLFALEEVSSFCYQ